MTPPIQRVVLTFCGGSFEIIEIMLCCHGGAHNDTICLAEKRLPMETGLFQ